MNNWISEKEQKNCLRMKCHASSTLRMALELWIASILRAKNAEACEFQMMKFMTEIQEFKALYADKVAIEMESKWKWKCVCERKNNELMTMEKMIVYIPSFHLLRRPVTKSPWLCSCADNQTKHKTKYQRNQHSRCEGGKTIFLSIFWYHYCAPINSEREKKQMSDKKWNIHTNKKKRNQTKWKKKVLQKEEFKSVIECGIHSVGIRTSRWKDFQRVRWVRRNECQECRYLRLKNVSSKLRNWNSHLTVACHSSVGKSLKMYLYKVPHSKWY